ncbi:MAG: enoyl-CoA hydratase-related protein [Hyphomicrobiales bacterium]|nr:enoyl-CoA hydratase-related protein [Hyphomicrobiales bacterium]
MSEPVLETEIDGRGVATVRLNRPEVNNAYNGEMVQGLIEGLAALGADPKVRVVVLRGNGRHFQAGADLAWVQANREKSADENLEVSRATTRAVHGLTAFPKPTVALVHGGCFGGGAGIAAACDIVIAAEDAIFAITEARWGLVATPIVPQLLSRLGPGRTRRYSLTCERFNGRRAFEIGLADEVCPADKLDETAAPIIDALLHCPPEALAQSKAAALHYAGLAFGEEELEAMAQPHAQKRMSEEADEGLNSFLEKREPAWYSP